MLPSPAACAVEAAARTDRSKHGNEEGSYLAQAGVERAGPAGRRSAAREALPEQPGPEPVDRRDRQRLQRRTEHPPQQQVRELGIAGKDRPVQVGGDHPTLHRTLHAVTHAVAHAALDPAQRCGVRPQRRGPEVVLEPGERAAQQGRIRGGDDLADRLIAPDHPGFGLSDDLPEVRAMDDLVYHYLDVLDRLGLDRVVGASFGGWIAAELALHSPERVRKLVLLGPAGLRIPEHPVADLFIMTPPQLLRALFHDPAIVENLLATEPGVEDILRSYRDLGALARFGWKPYLSNPKLEGRLRRVSAPTRASWPPRTIGSFRGRTASATPPRSRTQSSSSSTAAGTPSTASARTPSPPP
jgi:pimeloyl-ACP methyl ester carboxylesterase